jgi:hypothetical protein
MTGAWQSSSGRGDNGAAAEGRRSVQERAREGGREGKEKKGGTAVTGPPVEATRRGVGDGPRAAPRGGEEA